MYDSVLAPISVLCPWIKGSFSVSDRTLVVSLRNTFLGLVPAGKSSYNIPLSSISGCVLDRFYDTTSILLGMFMVFIGTVCFFDHATRAIGILLVLFGAALVAASIKTIIRVQNNGTELAVFIPFYGRDKAEKIKTMIDSAVTR